MQRDLRDAGVFDIEMVGFRQRQFQQDGQDHADDPAMAEDRDILSGMILDDLAQARFHAGAENLAALAIGHAMMMNLVEPFVRGETKFFLHPFPAEAAPIAEINLPQSLRIFCLCVPALSVGASVCCTRFIGLA